MDNLLEVAKGCAYNDRFEADAIQKYTELLQIIKDSSLSEDDKEMITREIREIIADELNHQKILREIYVTLTNIEPNKE